MRNQFPKLTELPAAGGYTNPAGGELATAGRHSSVQPLEYAGRAHAAADTHRHHAELRVAPPHLVHQLHCQLGPGTA